MLLFRRAAQWVRFFNFSTVKNPYDVLGLKPTATPDEIKKSYRTIAQQYHPDKNPDPTAQKKFIQAKQAYETLIDEDKRRQWDNDHGAASRSHGFDRNPFDQFNDEMYRDKSRTYHQTFTSGSTRKRKGDNIVRQLSLDFIDAAKGITIELTLERKCTCPSCGGNKCKPGTAPTRCLSCGGSGSTVYRRGGIVMHLECERCKGVGLVIKYPCLQCKATGILSQTVAERVVIPPGVESGQVLTVPEKGDQSENGPNGDMIIKIAVTKHPRFRKIGEDIHSTEWITISQAALGANRTLDTVWSKKQIKVPEGSQDGSTIVLKGEGVQGMKGRGNHVVSLRVKVPTRLTERQRKIFQELATAEDPVAAETEQTASQGSGDQESVFERMKKAFK